MGRSIICGQPRLRRNHRKGCHLYVQSIRFVVPVPLSQTFFIYRRSQDVLSEFDERDPTAARPTTREKARELCSEHMTEWASSGSGTLRNLRIGIPQVRSRFAGGLSPFDPLTPIRNNHRNTFRLRSTVPSYLPSAASFEPSRIAVRPCSPFPSQTPATP